MCGKTKSTSCILLAVLLMLFISNPSHAYVFYMDTFYVEKNGSQIFLDQFNDGNPPAYPTYSVQGTLLESGGKLELNSLYSSAFINPLGEMAYWNAASLRTNIDNYDLTYGLKCG